MWGPEDRVAQGGQCWADTRQRGWGSGGVAENLGYLMWVTLLLRMGQVDADAVGLVSQQIA